MNNENAALIGYGRWGKIILPYIAKFYPILRILNSKDDKNIIWNDKNIKNVFICTNEETHYEIAKEALLHNKNVFIEKPISLKFSEAMELEILATQKKLNIVVDYTQSFSPTIDLIISLSKTIGKIEEIFVFATNNQISINQNVYWKLHSHYLAIIDKIINLNELSYTFNNKNYFNNICSNGIIEITHKKDKHFYGEIDCKLINHEIIKEKFITILGKNGSIDYNISTGKIIYNLYGINIITYNISDENNNLNFAIKYFKDGKSNIIPAIKITKIIEDGCK